ncbi:MAG: HK97-gp10 family putative phage morphogenesis protein [Burkholderiales bacterium]
MQDTQHIKGLSDLNKFLQDLPVKLEKNILRSALRAGAKVMQTQAKANVPVQSGDLKKSIKIGTRARGGRVTASVKTKLWYAKWVEYGTRAHNIAAKKNGWLSFMGIFAKEVMHPGAKPHPFLRPALDATASAAVIAVGEKIKSRLTKEGLNVADVLVEGDE